MDDQAETLVLQTPLHVQALMLSIGDGSHKTSREYKPNILTTYLLMHLLMEKQKESRDAKVNYFAYN